MERDFLGLNSKETSTVVKEEINTGGFKETGFAKSSAIQWPFGNKVSAVPHLMSFKVAEEDKAKKIVYDPVSPPGFMSISTVGSYDPSQKLSVTEIQKPFILDRQGGTHFSFTTAHPMQHDAEMFPVPNHGIPVSVGHPFFKNYHTTPSQISQILGGIPVAVPQPVLPSVGSVVGTTDSCIKPSAALARLTIFYAGSVNVYDGVTPEKAQAIMLLAGDGSPQPITQVQAPKAKPVVADVSPVNQSNPALHFCRLSSPISAGAQSGSGSTSTEEIIVAKTNGIMEPPKVVNATGSVSTNYMMPSVPQARKASLARFLEKRKERAANVAPYNNIGVKSQTPPPKEINFSITSA